MPQSIKYNPKTKKYEVREYGKVIATYSTYKEAKNKAGENWRDKL
jgi:hypothetical protein